MSRSSIVLPIMVRHGPARMLPMSSTEAERWMSLADAAQVLGLRPETLRKQVKRGRRHGRRDNHGRWEVRLDPGASSTVAADAAHHGPASMPDISVRLAEREAELVELKAIITKLEAVAASRDAHLADLTAERTRLLEMIAAERQRVDRLLERLAERPAPRRRWRFWWRGGSG